MASRSGSVAILDAHILTMDPERPTAEALVIHDGEITFVGSTKAARHEHAHVDEVVRAGGRTMVPGFNDAHGHMIHDGMVSVLCDLAPATSRADAMARIRTYAAAHPDREVIVAERWDESDWPDPKFPTRSELDEAAGGRPVLARRIDGHTAVASTALLAIYDERWKGPWEGIDPETGLLLEEPSLQFSDMIPYQMEDELHGLDVFFATAARQGCTSVQDYERPNAWRAWQRKAQMRDRDGEDLPVRAFVSTYDDYLEAFADAGMETGTGSPFLRFGGVKMFTDGSLGGHTALLSEPYKDRPDTHGKQNYPDDVLLERVRLAQRNRIQVHMHAIGDGAIMQGCRAYAQVHDEVGHEPFSALRHRFEHYEMGTPQTHAELKRMNITASMQPNFVGAWCLHDGLYGERLGDRHDKNNQFRDLLDLGVALAFGSDCMPFGPLRGIRDAVNAPFAHQRVDLHEAIRAYTLGAAYAEHQERRKGMLKQGYLGDVTLLSKDLHATDPNDGAALADLTAHTTVSDGRIVYQASAS